MTLKSATMSFTRVRYSVAQKRGTRTSWSSSNSCGCGRSSGGCRSGGEDPAVDAIQDAGKEISCIFNLIQHREVAEELAKAIRWRESRVIQEILKHCGCDCKVVGFFCTGESDCVRICCEFGKWNEVKVTFDICIKRRKSSCGR
ncbi:hypothetical protein DFQ01_14035 [Paenibacillus cellulosilyticus]|uniref:Uncharacterized protein n=1 Tax=Paenibacillus cellulosilyticus TaxID=375489 RepID=A0A2V2YHI0_9BACL|nr:hypothetical protein [Paenibacillus cellulosilyticus]PWV90652.1 hypothetical protein DFQ01_14035 [Paenibacillus cellulosilyticus]QKS43926.1 hypothetical protein HUB94_05405 [Paenibacillus cellulosilyticus]